MAFNDIVYRVFQKMLFPPPPDPSANSTTSSSNSKDKDAASKATSKLRAFIKRSSEPLLNAEPKVT